MEERIIPARAGFTPPPRGRHRRPGDHPRSRGVYQLGLAGLDRVQGSSPLARGLLYLAGHPVLLFGIIPARAGFTPPTGSTVRRLSDHPRSRGVYHPDPLEPVRAHGSSPLARGLLAWVVSGVGAVRIIPARAGFTAPGCPVASPAPDHPRSRGVYVGSFSTDLQQSGSSPLARGLLAQTGRLPLDVGIIPARAGFTAKEVEGRADAADHPRSRGVYPTQRSRSWATAGSSPLARGLRGTSSMDFHKLRIIPARAGFTGLACRTRSICVDHPRSRGVYHVDINKNSVTHGSSPLARGLRPYAVYAGVE